MDEKKLLEMFTALASKSRSKNGISAKIAEFLTSEKQAGKKITQITSEQFEVEQLHIQALYTALKSLKIDLSNKAVEKSETDAHYFTRAIIKL